MRQCSNCQCWHLDHLPQAVLASCWKNKRCSQYQYGKPARPPNNDHEPWPFRLKNAVHYNFQGAEGELDALALCTARIQVAKARRAFATWIRAPLVKFDGSQSSVGTSRCWPHWVTCRRPLQPRPKSHGQCSCQDRVCLRPPGRHGFCAKLMERSMYLGVLSCEPREIVSPYAASQISEIGI